MKLANKHILITGASSGIGESICLQFAAEGALVHISARNETKLSSLLAQLSGSGHTMHLCELTDDDVIGEMVRALPLLDAVVHCAGIAELMPVKYQSMDNLRRIMKVNFESAVSLSSQLLRNKKMNKGCSFVFISSQAAQRPLFGSTAYSASKAALESFSRSLADELVTLKGRSNCIAPAYVNTPMTQNTANPFSGDFLKRFATIHAEGVGESSQVASIAAFLASDDSSWINGQVINAGRFSINIPNL